MSAAVILETLVEASTRALLVAGGVALVLAVFRVKAPAIRHAAWTGTLVVMALLPVVSGWMPTMPVSSLGSLASIRMPAYAPAPAAGSTAVVAVVSSPSLVTAGPATTDAPAGPSTSATRGAAVRTPTAVTSGLTWPEWMVVAWAVVALVFLGRELVGAHVARRLLQSGVLVNGERHVYQSARIISPVVVGVFAPRVMVPSSWPRWGAGVREMVLLHERAHVTRRDPLVACLARVNRAVFWFHPLAWWIERHLKVVSERACDEVVVRSGRDPRHYAAMLVEMAGRLRGDGRRVAWQGIGIVNPSRFEDRVDQVLAGPAPETSRFRKTGLAALCAVLVGVGLGCGAPVPPLAEDPDLARAIARQKERLADYEAAQRVTMVDVAELERVVAHDPDDLRATEKLVTFYSQRGQKLMGWYEMLAARRPHILRMIARHPESGLVRWPYARRLDPDGYDRARALWLTHVERADASTRVLSEAATFFERSEKPLAEQLLLRAQSADPNGPMPRDAVSGVRLFPWSRRLGVLYAMAIVGSDGDAWGDIVRAVNTETMSSAFAQHARQTLDGTSDAEMLVGASYYLSNQGANAKAGFDPRALGRDYAERALTLDPGSEGARQFLARPAHDAQYERMLSQLGKPAAELAEATFDQLSDKLKLEYAHELLWRPYSWVIYQRQDASAITAALTGLKRRAEEIERVAARAPASAMTASIRAVVHMALGTYAIKQGESREAVRRLRMATTETALAAPRAESRSGMSVGGARLSHDLLDAGERETVAAYYEAVSKVAEPWQRSGLEDAAAAIRAGRMPREYQLQLAGLR